MFATTPKSPLELYPELLVGRQQMKPVPREFYLPPIVGVDTQSITERLHDRMESERFLTDIGVLSPFGETPGVVSGCHEVALAALDFPKLPAPVSAATLAEQVKTYLEITDPFRTRPLPTDPTVVASDGGGTAAHLSRPTKKVRLSPKRDSTQPRETLLAQLVSDTALERINRIILENTSEKRTSWSRACSTIASEKLTDVKITTGLLRSHGRSQHYQEWRARNISPL